MSWDSPSYDELSAQAEAAFAAQATGVTDLRTGAVVTSLLRTYAILAQELSDDFVLRLDDAILASAYRSFGFALSGGAPATGSVTINFTAALGSPLTIPLGVIFQVPTTTLRYLSTAAVTTPAGSLSVVVPVQAENNGTQYNVPRYAVTQSLTTIVGVSSIRNDQPFVTGKNPETAAEREEAFRQHITALHPGTADAIKVGIANATLDDAFGTAIERVARVQVLETPGNLTIYIDGTNGTASSALVAQAQLLLDGGTSNGVTYPGLRAAGVTGTVVAATRISVPVHVRIRTRPGYSYAVVRPLVVDVVLREMARIDIGAPLFINRIRRAIAGLSEVDDFGIEAPTLNLTDQTGQLFICAPFEDQTSTNDPTSTNSWVGLL